MTGRPVWVKPLADALETWQPPSADSKLLVSLRLMAWERAKAELWSMLATYHDATEDYEAIETEIQGFIDTVEDRL